MTFDPSAAALPGSGIFGLPHSESEAALVLVPVPFEATTSYGGGTSRGPEAVLGASRQIDLFDVETGRPYEQGIHLATAPEEIERVLAAYLVLFPRARVLTLVVIFIFVRLIPLPAGWFIGIWFAGQLLSVFLGANTGVAFFAHIGGFVAGFVLVRLVGRRTAWRARRAGW